jgi:hypothetical protein
MSFMELAADDIARLVFEDFTYDAMAAVGDVKMLVEGSAPTKLAKEAELWFDISTCKSQEAEEHWICCAENVKKCKRSMAYANSLLRELEHAKEHANYLLSREYSTNENIVPAKGDCTKAIAKRKPLRRKTVGVCVGFPQKGCGQVTSRMGPSGPQTLCNACGVRYLKQNKKR